MDRKFGERVVFLENYNMQIAKLLIQGCDIWLNNPRRPLEASGTSGMKAAMNGVLNLSVMDGWVPEGPQHGVSGWLIEHAGKAPEQEQDQLDMQTLYKILLEEVIPTYYENRNAWVEMMRASIDMSRWQFSSHRMLREYYDVLYLPTKRAQLHPAVQAGNEYIPYEQIHQPTQYQ
jgi:starch phosphorylase